VATVRCPKCGTINPNGRRRLARCRRCHEALGKCRYCEHYDFQMQDCTHPAREPGVRVLDADEVLNCAEFSSTLTTTGAALRRVVLVPWAGRPARRLGFLAMVVALAGALAVVHTYWAGSRAVPPALLRVAVSAPPVSFQDEGFDVNVLVLNEADYPAREVKVFISGRSLRHLTCQSVEPPEAFLEASPQVVCALVGNLGPGEIGSTVFHFLSAKSGELDLSAHVTAANVEGPQTLPMEGEVIP